MVLLGTSNVIEIFEKHYMNAYIYFSNMPFWKQCLICHSCGNQWVMVGDYLLSSSFLRISDFGASGFQSIQVNGLYELKWSVYSIKYGRTAPDISISRHLTGGWLGERSYQKGSLASHFISSMNFNDNCANIYTRTFLFLCEEGWRLSSDIKSKILCGNEHMNLYTVLGYWDFSQT